MKQDRQLYLVLFILLFIGFGYCDADNNDRHTLSDTEIGRLIDTLNSYPNWNGQEDTALDYLLPYSNNPKVFEALIKELDKLKRINKITNTGEYYGEYYLDVLSALSKSDVTSKEGIGVFIDNVGCSKTIEDIVIKNANDALPLVMKRLNELDKLQDDKH
jgi:hypothetical protein